MVFDSIMAGPRNAQPAPWRLRARTPRQSNRTARSWESLTIRPTTTTRSPTIRGNQRGESESTVIDVEIVDAGTPRRP